MRTHGIQVVRFILCSVFTLCPAVAADPIQIDLEVVASGLTAPVALTHAGDDSGRLFVADQAGQIRVIQGGVLLPVPFLDLTAKLPTLGTIFDERGLLGLAFHPNYRNNGRFFVRYSAPRVGGPSEPCSDPLNFIPGCHMEILAEYKATPPSSNVADPLSEIILFSVDEPEFNHNAGAVAFGPDGFLYFSLGDGGGANDGLDLPTLPHGPIGNGQNIDTPLGAMLRFDVDSPPAPGLNYAIPPSNPFVGGPGLDEIYAYGFRNPFSFSFDDGPGGDGKLIVADVGQDLFEEIDIVVAGGNYGWAIREGFSCFNPLQPAVPAPMCPAVGPILGDPLLDPVSEYAHVDGGLSVIGGFVYRGMQFPALLARYVYGDFSADFGPTGRLYYFELTGMGAFVRKEFYLHPNGDPLGKYLKGFGEDQNGEIYVLVSTALAPTGTSGEVLRIVAPPTGACCRGFLCQEVTSTDCAALSGSYQGDGVACLGDTDGDGADARCGDACPNDPNKTAPGACGCNASDADSDGDSVPDCNDLCPGFDDAIPGCQSAIPAASEWGLMVLALSLMVLGKLWFGGRTELGAAARH